MQRGGPPIFVTIVPKAIGIDRYQCSSKEHVKCQEMINQTPMLLLGTNAW